MKEISDQEFEQNVIKLIKKEITRVDLAKELKTDTRTLTNRIYQMKNEELLKQYLSEYSYKPKKNENINYENLIIEIVKNSEKIGEVQDLYNIAERTYRRNIDRIKTINPRLYQIYKDYLHNTLSYEDKEYIDSLEEGPVAVTNNIEDRKAQLMDLFSKYYEMLGLGLDEKDALRYLNENTRSFKRKSDEFERILKEEKINNSVNEKESTNKRRKENFTNSLKFENIVIQNIETKNDIKEVEREL